MLEISGDKDRPAVFCYLVELFIRRVDELVRNRFWDD